MEDITHKKCIRKDCKTHPIEKKQPLYCVIIRKRCFHKDCKTHPSYNKEGEKNLFIVLNIN
jgi:hypothetical protein